jgi:hypothetical protein
MRYFLFLDESGDHGLSNIDPNFPVFVLCGVLISEESYKLIESKIKAIKRKYWGDKKVLFHSSDIRKCDKEFQILFDEKLKANFYRDLNKLMKEEKYTVISSVVNKDLYIKRYGKLGTDIYTLCLSNTIERTVFYMDDIKDSSKKVQILIENRGKKEDRALNEHIRNILNRGTGYVKANRIQALIESHNFYCKDDDVTGLQIADLIAYPIARYIMDRARANPAFDLISNKFYVKNARNYGLKIMP